MTFEGVLAPEPQVFNIPLFFNILHFKNIQTKWHCKRESQQWCSSHNVSKNNRSKNHQN